MSVTTADYGFLEPQTVHFDDLDGFGMLHNSHYAVLAERAWVAYWQRREVAFSRDWELLDDGYNVAKELLVGFDLPIGRPGTYGVHAWVERLGRTSLTYGFRVCSEDASLTYAHGHRTVVRLERTTLRPTEWSGRVRELCQDLGRPASSA
ncbi:acyl-CoA thioesterase [Streptomyces sp. NBC_01497]|uniref:acyl-CoA thioesterase n=1 Tax=Streptomyces sp. NBC_01497 TaxID=2903885 RepID=UPI002E35386A|nr:hotdog domain-containing protein [Streptomyces sp. NBC_01497]